MSDDRPDEVKQNKAQTKFLLWLVCVLIVLSIGNFARSFVVQNAAEDASSAANAVNVTAGEGRNASIETLDELREILQTIEEQNSGEPSLNNQMIIDALVAIGRIEVFLCGGPCPLPEEE